MIDHSVLNLPMISRPVVLISLPPPLAIGLFARNQVVRIDRKLRFDAIYEGIIILFDFGTTEEVDQRKEMHNRNKKYRIHDMLSGCNVPSY
jgi:hypothetical protein